MEIININEAKTNFSKLLSRVHSGEEIIIAKAGKPFVKIVPLKKPVRREPGLASGRVTDAFFEPLPEEELRHWE